MQSPVFHVLSGQAPGVHIPAPACDQFSGAGGSREPCSPPLSSPSSSSTLQHRQPGKQLAWDKTQNLKQSFHSGKPWLEMQGLGGQVSRQRRCLPAQEQLLLLHLEIKWTQSSLPFANSLHIIWMLLKIRILHVDCTKLRSQNNSISSFLWYRSQGYSWISKAPPFSFPFLPHK